MTSDANIPIIGKSKHAAPILNTDMLKASVPDLLSEIERRGVNLPQTSFQLIQSLHDHRNSRWNANNGARTVEKVGDAWRVREGDLDGEGQGGEVARFYNETDAIAWANPQFTIFERAAEVAGEVGELVNAVKKLRRHDMKMPGNYKEGEADRDKLLERAAYEIGDVFVTAFNLSQQLNLDAFNCLQLAFNTKSREMGFPEEI